MISSNRTQKTFIFLLAAILLIFIFLNYQSLTWIQKESRHFSDQKNKRLAQEAQARHIEEFQEVRRADPSSLEKIDQVFIKQTEPVAFIEFLEREAANFQLQLDIAPGPLLGFQVNLTGSFPNTLRFLKRVELGDYLATVSNLNLQRLDKNKIAASLLIRVYSR